MLDLRAGAGVTLTKDPASGTLKIDLGVSANDLFIDPRKGPYNAAGNGTTDDAAALQSALNTGKLVYLDPSLTFAFGTRLLPPSGGGFIGGGTLLMLTGTGKFDAANYAASYDRLIGIYVDNVSNVRIEANIKMQANAGVRTCNPIWVRQCTNVQLDVEISGFKEMFFGAIEWNSNNEGYVKAYIHDIVATANTLPGMQITGLSVDANRYNPGPGFASVNSRRLRFDVQAKNISMGAAAITAYGYQTDAVNLQGTNGAGDYAGHQGRVQSENVHEPLDIFCDHCVVDVTARECLYGVKLIHGASYNVIRATIHNVMKDAVFIGGSSELKATHNNKVTATISGIGSYLPGTFTSTAVSIDGSGATYGANSNEVNVTFEPDPAGNTDYGVGIGTANDNIVTFEKQGSGAIPTGQLAVITSGTGNIIRRLRPGIVRAYLSADTTYAADTTVVFNTVDFDPFTEYNSATGIFTVKVPGKYRITYSAQVNATAGQLFGSYIRKSGTILSRRDSLNASATTQSLGHLNTVIASVVPGDTIFIRSDSTGSLYHYGGSATTYLEIEPL